MEEVKSCIGCMTVPAEIKLIRRCESSGENPCVTCYCRPMWCLTYLAMRQDQNRPETWLVSKCPCPICRSKFCILDVSLIQENWIKSSIVMIFLSVVCLFSLTNKLIYHIKMTNILGLFLLQKLPKTEHNYLGGWRTLDPVGFGDSHTYEWMNYYPNR